MVRISRLALVEQVQRELAASGRVTLAGPAGIGRSTLLADVVAALPGRVRHLRPAPTDCAVPGAALAALSESCALPVAATGNAEDSLRLRLSVRDLVREAEVLAIDDAHLLDELSADVLAAAVHHTGVRVITTVRSPAAERITGARPFAVPPFDTDQVAVLLEAHGLAYRLAGRVHAASGGIPRLALELGQAVAVPQAALELLAPLDHDAHVTLLLAALAQRPTLRLLRRAGRGGADEHIAAAVAAGLVSITDDDQVVIRAGAVASALVASATAGERARCHGALAAATEDPTARLWHFASMRHTPDAELAGRLAAAAAGSRDRGLPVRAAELALRAVDLAPVTSPDGTVSGWLAGAAVDAAAGGRADLCNRALSLLESSGAARADIVRARIAAVDAAGQALDGLDELLARALVEATGLPELLAAVHLRLALRANLAEGSPDRASAHARHAAQQARRAGDSTAQAQALTMLARMQRILGDPSAESTLAEALALSPEPPVVDLRDSPHYLAVRHAVFDDRLDDARSALLELLPVAEVCGLAEDMVDMLRSLAEVEVRTGRCGAAMVHAARALGICEGAGMSPGPGWFTAAVVELAGGSLSKADGYAHRAVRASAEERDQVYLARALHVTGLIRLVGRDAVGAVEVLRRVRTLEIAQHVVDPSQLRWHGDLAEALVAIGELPEAYRTMVEARQVAARLGRRGVLAALDRAEGLYRSAAGDGAHAVALLHRADEHFALLGMPLERGRALLALSVAQRRRRHRSAAREAQQQAVAVFTEIGAANWAELARATFDGEAGPAVGELGLTDAESRVVELVGRGASNREIAAALFLSVKTVEAMLTRIYRRLGVRSRTQLVTLLRGAG
ncbi:DNA-binding CsgD family transcriptional regulator [Allocatelliglobosispora scoriae]|uniref:DNA-binding CsgD family transcriptional regulator n=1 Tax=Allocatelliglobosispora scoriae TaxID=643052 RepID=A0A841BN56_9ACTN|nr:helix-turn-helix transcriptional regulator [Allocatelliglobosispora scoriae]MBB5868250.1 DNA-binding CsgD family transcriptional regulator [Allocatelliglobosispora scoriae]